MIFVPDYIEYETFTYPEDLFQKELLLQVYYCNFAGYTDRSRGESYLSSHFAALRILPSWKSSWIFMKVHQIWWQNDVRILLNLLGHWDREYWPCPLHLDQIPLVIRNFHESSWRFPMVTQSDWMCMNLPPGQIDIHDFISDIILLHVKNKAVSLKVVNGVAHLRRKPQEENPWRFWK